LVFALTLVALGAWTLIAGEFAAVWQPIARGVPCREALRYACAFLALAGGAGLLWTRAAAAAARGVLGLFLLWLLWVKVPAIIKAPAVAVSYESAGETAVIVAGALVLYAWFAADQDQRRLRSASALHALGLARVLFALALLAFGQSHFAYVQETASLVPRWLPAHPALAYVTGVAYLAAGAAVLSGRLAALAAALSAVQMGLFTALVWAPVIAAGAAQRDEFVISWTLTAAAWMVAESYRSPSPTAR
jgi:uncharacterized membrane protein